MCTDGTAEHKNAFKSFVENELQCKVIWVSTKTDLQLGSKYLLLCNVTSRIPDDLDFFLKELSIKGNCLKKLKLLRVIINTLLVCFFGGGGLILIWQFQSMPALIKTVYE